MGVAGLVLGDFCGLGMGGQTCRGSRLRGCGAIRHCPTSVLGSFRKGGRNERGVHNEEERRL
jgi:hypothetical protein